MPVEQPLQEVIAGEEVEVAVLLFVAVEVELIIQDSSDLGAAEVSLIAADVAASAGLHRGRPIGQVAQCSITLFTAAWALASRDLKCCLMMSPCSPLRVRGHAWSAAKSGRAWLASSCETSGWMPRPQASHGTQWARMQRAVSFLPLQ